jgi:hypothetical protein
MRKNLDNESCINCQKLNCIKCDEAEDWQKIPIKNEAIVPRIIASAFQLTNGQIFVGKCHADAQKNAMAIMGEDNYLKEKPIKDGFITTRLQFVNRREAYIIAKNNGQFKRYEIQKACGVENGYDGDELYSEDLW